jgi:hypothetical protein
MTENVVQIPSAFYRCAGPNCGVLKGASDRWWVMWSSFDDHDAPVMHLAPWDDKLAVQAGALHVCGEGCAQIAVAVHGQCSGEPVAEKRRLGSQQRRSDE